MSRGHVARASVRYPGARRRAARYGRTVRARRAGTLPPHLLPGITRRPKSMGMTRRRLLLVGAQLMLLGLLFAFTSFVVSTVAFVGGTTTAYREVNEGLPNAALVAADTFQSSKIFDRNGNLLQDVADPDLGWRTFVPLDQVSQHLIDATVAAEDSTFWTHHGVEPVAIVRGAVITVTGAGSSGGSTITQQLVRSLFPEDIGNDVSINRKVKEALAAIELERQYSKHDILTMYLNQIYYGNRAYGIEAAAQTFFNKHASEVTLAEAAMLAGLPQAPTAYNPVVNYETAKVRQQYVLDQMVKYHYITRDESAAAFAELLQPQTRSSAVLHAPHFVNYVHEYIAERFGDNALYTGGLQIYTTIDIDLQERAQQILREHVATLADYNASNGAMVVMLPWSGEIVAMVGSADFNDASIDGQVNVAIAERQPGSSIKPITYAAAFEKGWNPGTTIVDERIRIETPLADEPYYEPQNYTGRTYGRMTIRTALSNSLNIPAVKTLQFVGVQAFLDLAHKMGIRTGLQRGTDFYGLAITLGGGEVQPLELTNVYGTLANNGRYVPATPILKIADSQGNVLYDLDRAHTLEKGEQVLKPESAYGITDILTDNAARGMIFGRGNLFEQTADALGRPVTAKSGTTNDWKDNWTMGYTTDSVVGVWVGNSDNRPLAEIDGIQGAGPIWSTTMQVLHSDFAHLLVGPNGQPLPKEFSRPAGYNPQPTGGDRIVPTDGGGDNGGDGNNGGNVVDATDGGGPAIEPTGGEPAGGDGSDDGAGDQGRLRDRIDDAQPTIAPSGG